MSELVDLGPAAAALARLVADVGDEQLAAPTPCAEYRLGDLLDHVGGLAVAFAAAAQKDTGAATSQRPSGDSSRLGANWRTRIPAQLAALAEAWRDPAAWEGMTKAGSVELPAAIAGKVAVDELVIHGWDVARATGQEFECDPPALNAALEFVSMMAQRSETAGRGGLFGPIVEVPATAPLLDQVIGLSGRDPGWRAR